MSLSYSESTLKKALHWLDNQNEDWPQYIKDSNIAVKMYLKSQKKEEEESSSFQKELAGLLGPDTGAVSTDFKSPPAKTIQKNNSFTLDEKSRLALEQTKKELNIENDNEALKLLIQLGKKSLNRLY